MDPLTLAVIIAGGSGVLAVGLALVIGVLTRDKGEQP